MLDSKKLKTFNCSACGGDLEIKNLRTKFVSCPYCGTTSDLSGVVKTTKKGDPNQFKPRSFLKIGDIATFNGIAHQIIGRTCWHNDYKEYDHEDRKYYNETWDFDEWILLSDEGNYKTIIEDKEGYKIAETIIPKYPSLPENGKIQEFNTGISKKASEYGKSTIQYFEGESTYLVEIGDYSKFAQYSVGGKAYIAEWRYFENGELKEVEFFKETKISKRNLLKAFGEEQSTTESENSQGEAPPKDRKASKLLFLGFGLLNVIIGIYFISISSSDTTLFYRAATLNQENWTPLNDSLLYAEGEFDIKLGIPQDIPFISEYTTAEFPNDSLEITSYLYFLSEQNDTIAAFSNYFYSYHSDDSTAEKTSELLNFTTEGLSDSLKLAMRFEMPKKVFSRSNGIKIGYLFQKEGNDYRGGANFTMMLGFFMLFIGYLIHKKDVKEN